MLKILNKIAKKHYRDLCRVEKYASESQNSFCMKSCIVGHRISPQMIFCKYVSKIKVEIYQYFCNSKDIDRSILILSEIHLRLQMKKKKVKVALKN